VGGTYSQGSYIEAVMIMMIIMMIMIKRKRRRGLE